MSVTVALKELNETSRDFKNDKAFHLNYQMLSRPTASHAKEFNLR